MTRPGLHPRLEFVSGFDVESDQLAVTEVGKFMHLRVVGLAKVLESVKATASNDQVIHIGHGSTSAHQELPGVDVLEIPVKVKTQRFETLVSLTSQDIYVRYVSPLLYHSRRLRMFKNQ